MYQVTVLLVLNFDGKRILHLEQESHKQAIKKKNTLIFNAFVFSQVIFYKWAGWVTWDGLKQNEYCLFLLLVKIDFEVANQSNCRYSMSLMLGNLMR